MESELKRTTKLNNSKPKPSTTGSVGKQLDIYPKIYGTVMKEVKYKKKKIKREADGSNWRIFVMDRDNRMIGCEMECSYRSRTNPNNNIGGIFFNFHFYTHAPRQNSIYYNLIKKVICFIEYWKTDRIRYSVVENSSLEST